MLQPRPAIRQRRFKARRFRSLTPTGVPAGYFYFYHSGALTRDFAMATLGEIRGLGKKAVAMSTGNIPPLFSERQLRRMAYAAVGILLFLSTFVIVKPSYLEFEVVRFTTCLLLSLCLAIFFFVFWPQQLELTEIPVIKLPVRVTGPVVLWIIVLLFLLALMPQSAGNYCQFFRPEPPRLAFSSRIKLEGTKGEPLASHFAEDDRKPGYVGGVYVTFPRGVGSLSANLKVPDHNTLEVTFSRGLNTFDVSGLALKD